MTGAGKPVIVADLDWAKKPCLRLCAGDEAAADKLNAFIDEQGVKVLNVAGPRASNELGVGEFVMRTLLESF
jgi:hypothetical protein